MDDIKFKVVFVDRKTYKKNDLTEKFKRGLKIENKIYISWEKFLKIASEMNLYGLYIITVPVGCGLSNKYNQDWGVLCSNKNTIKAGIMKTYTQQKG